MIYVDDPIYSFGRMKMCHMIADSTSELLIMADTIGVDRKWIQKAGTYREHFDICKSKRQLTVVSGAKEISSRELGLILRKRRLESRMENASRSTYLFEDWYNGQTPRWDKLCEAGWVFAKPQYVPGTVGIQVRRGMDSAEFRVDARLSREEINTRLLRFCEMFDVESSR